MDRIKFKVNGVERTVGCEVSSDVTLLDYIRNTLQLKGTKYMCREAGCGACIVNVKRPPDMSYAVNSCMVSITSCQGWEITTIEEVGNRIKGYHILQSTLAKENGSQCGYCSPAWVMTMYSILTNNPDITMLEIEKSLASNTCRCTGYRPILDAFKKFAKDAPKPIHISDIEDLNICKKTGEACDKDKCEERDWCIISRQEIGDEIIEINLKDNRLWVRVNTIDDIFAVLSRKGDDSYMLVCGNTAKGAYPISEYPSLIIDISGVEELKGYTLDQNLIVKANTTLTEFLNILKTMSKEEGFDYLQKLYDHIQNVAHIPVRNIGSIAGNLMIKHKHRWFASDIFLLLETVGAQLTIQHSANSKSNVTMQEFLKLDMKGHVLRCILMPPLTKDYHLTTFKIMPRSQNAHALIHAGFLYKLFGSNHIVKEVRIVYGALSPNCIRATKTEQYLVGKELFNNSTLRGALDSLEKELEVLPNPPEASMVYRKQVALGLFYKGLLKLCPEELISKRNRSGASNLNETRPVSKATQVYDTNILKWPLNKPIMKKEAMIQCAGEAYYTDDLPPLPHEVYCAFALSTIAVGKIVKINSTEALAYPGVICVYTAKDIPGLNSFSAPDVFPFSSLEEVICSGKVAYFNQPIAIVVAETKHIAETAAKLVTATYENVKEPVLDVKETIGTLKAPLIVDIKATDKGNDVKTIMKGTDAIHSQFHMTMETLTCVTKPSDEGLDVYCASQWLDAVQQVISKALKMDKNRIDVHNRRVGGAYGIKISRSIQGAVASALVALKLNRPCRFIQSLTTNTRAVGKRLPCAMKYELGVDKAGVIQFFNNDTYSDNAYVVNELLYLFAITSYYNCYKKERWNYKHFTSLTDTASNTWARSPATLESIALSELVMDRISYEISLDPLEVRLANLDVAKHGALKKMADAMKTSADYNNRKELVIKFNRENRWKKRGLRVVLLQWTPHVSLNMCITLSVYHGDGSVAITHGGIEVGQGINTRAAQVAAYLLNIPVDKVIVKENNTMIAPNVQLTGGSVSSTSVTIGVTRACEELLKRLNPLRAQMDNPTWLDLIKKAYLGNIDLQTHGFTRTDEKIKTPVYGVTFAEVELDVITGEYQILKVDLCEDTGYSINPQIDVGQVEGAFIMGVGYWTCEHIMYAPSGEVLTDRTWNYKVPLARDIPQDWNIRLIQSSDSSKPGYGSKSVGEPPMCMSVVIALAIREAVVAARLEAGIPTTQWYSEDGPHTVERSCLQACTKISDFKF